MLEFEGLSLRTCVTTLQFAETDWAATSLGRVRDWSPHSRIAIQTCLNSRLPMALCLGDDLLLVYNDAYLPILAHKHPAAFGRPALKVFEDIAGFLEAGVDRVVRQRQTVQASNQMLALNRNSVVREGYFTLSYSPLLDSEGGLLGIFVVAHETTDSTIDARRQRTLTLLSTALIKAARDINVPRFREAFASNPMDLHKLTLFALTQDGAIESRWYVNHEDAETAPAHYRHARRARLALERLKLQETTSRQLGERVFALILRVSGANSRGFVLIMEPAPLVHPDPDYQTFLDVIREIAGGGIYRALAERQAYSQIREQLDQRTYLYRLLFEHTGEAIILSDARGRILAANPAACQLTQYSETELQQHVQQNLIATETHAALQKGIETLLQGGAGNGMLRLRRKDGSLLDVDVASSLLTGNEGEAPRIVSLLRDASERLRSQERLTSTARLQALGQLTSGISQDYNDLLGVMLLGAESLQADHRDHSETSKTAQLVVSAALRATDLTRQLLTFSQHRPMQLEQVEVGHLLNEFGAVLKRTLGEQIQLRLHHHDHLQVWTDPSQLHNALLNIALNARDAMPDGGTLEITTLARLLDNADAAALDVQPGAFVEINVRDTGIGIPEDQLPRIIEPFFTSKAQGKGTGLGLSMVYGFVRQSGGQLKIDSKPAKGTRVQLLLPASTGSRQTDAGLSSQTPRHEISGQWHSRLAILVADQNTLLAEMLVRALRHQGLDVHHCEDVPEVERALECIGDRHPLLLLDNRLLEGQARDNKAFRDLLLRSPELSIMLMSGHQKHDPAPHTPFRTLVKPFRMATLLEALQDHANTAGPDFRPALDRVPRRVTAAADARNPGDRKPGHH